MVEKETKRALFRQCFSHTRPLGVVDRTRPVFQALLLSALLFASFLLLLQVEPHQLSALARAAAASGKPDIPCIGVDPYGTQHVRKQVNFAALGEFVCAFILTRSISGRRDWVPLKSEIPFTTKYCPYFCAGATSNNPRVSGFQALRCYSSVSSPW